MMPTEDGNFRRSSTVYTDQQTKQLMERLKLNTIDETEEGRRTRKTKEDSGRRLLPGDD